MGVGGEAPQRDRNQKAVLTEGQQATVLGSERKCLGMHMQVCVCVCTQYTTHGQVTSNLPAQAGHDTHQAVNQQRARQDQGPLLTTTWGSMGALPRACPCLLACGRRKLLRAPPPQAHCQGHLQQSECLCPLPQNAHIET